MAVANGVEQAHQVGFIEREIARKKSEEDDAAGPGVNFLAVVSGICARYNLRGDVVRSAALGGEQICGGVGTLDGAEAEIGDLQNTGCSVNEKVLRLEVAM